MARIAFASVLLSPAASLAAPEDRGPFVVATWEAGDVDAAGVSLPTTVYYPEDADAPSPLVAVIHGFQRTGRTHVENAPAKEEGGCGCGIASGGPAALAPALLLAALGAGRFRLR